MRALLILLVLASSLPLEASRRRAVSRGPATLTVADDFRNGALGWTALFADYSPVHAEIMELDSGIRPLPPELGIIGTGFYITAHNRSDDVFMFLTKRLTPLDGIEPHQLYEVAYRIVAASNAGTGCVGIGGAPGESVYFKVGATGTEPRVQLDAMNYWRVNFDKNNQSQSGTQASVAGNIANGTDVCRGDAPFVSIERTHTHTHLVRSNEFGELWLIVGTESGFEGKTQLYYQTIEATLTPR